MALGVGPYNRIRVYHKVTGMQEEGQGEQMPLAGPFLSEQQVQLISDRILEGAANN